MPTIKGFMAVSTSDFIEHEGKPFFIGHSSSGFRPVYLSRAAAEQTCLEYQSVERVDLTVGEHDFFRFQHGPSKFEFTDYRHYRNALRRWKSAKHPLAEILIMEQRTSVTETITFADDPGSAQETATDFDDRWMCNFLTFLDR